jgi:hypothetical protein
MLKLVYCDWIAALVRESLIERSNTSSRPIQLTDISGLQFDLRADGSFLSTKKTLTCKDSNGTAYRITVEEVR